MAGNNCKYKLKKIELFYENLMLGHCSYYTISNFVKALKEYSEEFEITVADPVMPGGENMKTEEAKSI